MTATYSDITNKFTFSCPRTTTLGLGALSTMNNCTGFPSGTVANSYTSNTTYNATTLTTTIQRANLISITLNTTDRLRFTEHTGTNRDVQISANPLSSCSSYTGNYFNIRLGYNMHV